MLLAIRSNSFLEGAAIPYSTKFGLKTRLIEFMHPNHVFNKYVASRGLSLREMVAKIAVKLFLESGHEDLRRYFNVDLTKMQ